MGLVYKHNALRWIIKYENQVDQRKLTHNALLRKEGRSGILRSEEVEGKR